VSLPSCTVNGDLPPGLHRATLAEVVARFGSGSPQRRLVGLRLERIYHVARATGHLARCVVFGSFVMAKLLPHDVDVFLAASRLRITAPRGFDIGSRTIHFRHSRKHPVASTLGF
jgi:uncharacterized protein DUF6932